jgi:hypothetical protein
VAPSIDGGLLGPAATPWIADGATAYAAGLWFGRDLEEWSAWLRAGGLAPTVAALVDAQATETTSPHLVVPLRAALFHFLLEGRGVDFVRGLWTGKEVLRVDADLDRNFGRWLDDAAVPLRAAIGERHVQRRAALLGGSFLAAVGMEEPSPVPDRGFGSEAFLRSLADARSLGANAVAFTCYAVAERDPLPLPDLAPGARARRAIGPTCGDLRLFAAACQTRGQSMRTLFQPRWLTAPGGSLAGTGPQEGEVGWKRFFDGYERFVVHFALLAELAGADGLSLGGGLTASTSASDGGWRSSSEEVGWRREGWRRVVRAARAAFSGSITWAADSVVDATEVAFWEDLDLVACDLQADYDAHGTSFHASPVMQMSLEYSTQIEALERICEARGLPLLLTQVGFRSGMPEPGAPRSGVLARSDGLQAMQFSALGTVLAQARERDVLRGAVLWRWSTDPADAGASPRDGLIRTGPAREAVARILSSR